ncbi:juvenile hormone acid O-methyltransferase-like isoform X2 [Ptychodera flava]|uniref:juvenile hormone acid O-methyltransferase-like isoform X2 n=1 Tax=Ptychodera flava TaxID=63121 RepID=UPI00396A7FE8
MDPLRRLRYVGTLNGKIHQNDTVTMNFDRLPTYHAKRSKQALTSVEQISQALSLDQRDALLDVGCGPGQLTILLSKRVGRVTAFDVSCEMIAEAKKNNQAENITYNIGDATKLTTYKEYSQAFDKTVAYFCLHWMKDSKAALQGIYQSLKPGGLCFLNMTQENPDVVDTLRVLGSYISPKWEHFMKGYKHAYYPFKGNADDFKEVLFDIGFKDVNCRLVVNKLLMTFDEAIVHYPNFMNQLRRIPEDKKKEYVEEAVKYVMDTGFKDDEGYNMTTSLIVAVARK